MPHGIVQASLVLAEEPANIARSLPDAVLVLDQRDAHIALAMFAEADPGRHRDIGPLDQKFGKSNRADRLNFSGIGTQANIVAGGGGTGQPARANASTSVSRRER